MGFHMWETKYNGYNGRTLIHIFEELVQKTLFFYMVWYNAECLVKDLIEENKQIV